MKRHKDLEVWKKSISLISSIYTATTDFPASEVYGITNQIRRSAVSIPSNIAEGSVRQGNKEFVQFLYISLGSLAELETQLIIARNLDCLLLKDYESLIANLVYIRKMLLGLIIHKEKVVKSHHSLLITHNPQPITHNPSYNESTKKIFKTILLA